jgi:hypothetical protein
MVPPTDLICSSPPPTNKLKVRVSLDLNPESPAGSFSSHASMQAEAFASLLADRGGEGAGCKSALVYSS